MNKELKTKKNKKYFDNINFNLKNEILDYLPFKKKVNIGLGLCKSFKAKFEKKKYKSTTYRTPHNSQRDSHTMQMQKKKKCYHD